MIVMAVMATMVVMPIKIFATMTIKTAGVPACFPRPNRHDDPCQGASQVIPS